MKITKVEELKKEILKGVKNKSVDDEKINELIGNNDIIRNKLKIRASVNNARIFRNIVLDFGSFY
mgnify:CR=1 FL=1